MKLSNLLPHSQAESSFPHPVDPVLLDALTFFNYYLVMRATITSKGQITIPVRIREKLDLKAGDVLEFDEEAACLKGHKVFDPEAMYAVIGCRADIRPDVTSTELLEELRGPAEPGEDADGD